MTQATYPVPAGDLERVTEIRKSRFIARARGIRNRDQARDHVATARAAHPDASHHCWAYVLGRPGAATSAAMNDDGEPSGTAGRPILNVIEHKGIGDILVVVTRYFGGVKLGAGGLVRAYAGAAEAVLRDLPVARREPRVQQRVILDFPDEQPLRHWADRHGAHLGDIQYGERLVAMVELPEKHLEALRELAGSRGIQLKPPASDKQ